MLYGKIERTIQSYEIQSIDKIKIQNEIDVLRKRIKLLQNSLPCITWTDTTSSIFNVVDIEIDKDLLKQNDDTNYIGKAYAIEFIGNKKHYKPIYFKKSELKELYKQ